MAFCLPPKEAIDLVFNATKAIISSESDVILGTASHLYAVSSEWSKQYELGRVLSGCEDEIKGTAVRLRIRAKPHGFQTRVYSSSTVVGRVPQVRHDDLAKDQVHHPVGFTSETTS